MSFLSKSSDGNADLTPKYNIVGQNRIQIFSGVGKNDTYRTWFFGALGVIVAFVLVGGFALVMVKQGAPKILAPYISDLAGLPIEKLVTNPLNGVLYKETDAASWINTRPLSVMVNNYTDARPQSGLKDADLIYEIVAEGGITRYLAFFLSNAPEKIGPVRSTREYYLVLVKELGDAMIMHIGWSPQALEAIETWPVRSLGRGGASFWRDQDRINRGVAIEHTAYVNGKDLRVLSEDLGWQGTRDFRAWKFKDEGPVDKAQQCLVGECDKPITIDFWYKGDYSGLFSYDRTSNSYLRFTGYEESGSPIPTVDQESGEQLKVKTVIVQFVKETSIVGDEKNRLIYELAGSGSGVIFYDGKATKVTWSKASRDERTLFYDESGNEMSFNRGKIWISIVPDRNVDQVVY